LHSTDAEKTQRRFQRSGNRGLWKRRLHSSHHTLWLAAGNAIIVILIIVIFIAFAGSSRQKMYEQNISDIRNINRSAANISSDFFLNQRSRLINASEYIRLKNLDYDEALDYIATVETGSAGSFELLDSEARGFASLRKNAGFIPVEYRSPDYERLMKICAESGSAQKQNTVFFTPEFTDSLNARNSFAFYRYIALSRRQNGAPPQIHNYTLLSICRTKQYRGLLETDSGYRDLATALVNRQGDYVIADSAFKSDNLFRYFYVFNNLSLEERMRLESEFPADGGGIYYLKDAGGRDSVFVYASVPGTDWIAVSSVPLSSFHNSRLDLSFTLIIALLLIALMLMDMLWLEGINRRLEESAQREKEASAAKTDFLSRMSHDIRTPLNVIIGTTILAEDIPENPPETAKYLRNIEQSGSFLAALVNDILDLNKVESGKMELHLQPYSASQFRQGISAIIQPLCDKKNIAFSIEGDDSTPPLMLDRMRVNQIFYNILSNSVKFTPEGGWIKLSYSLSFAGPAREADSGDRAGGRQARIEFAAADNGSGMSTEFQRHMFEAFSQESPSMRPAIQGTGLGLAIVKNLVDLMKGSIQVESLPGKGTVFHIVLPAETAPQSLIEQPVAGSVLPLGGRHILLCEDNPLNSEIARKILETKGMTVDCAEDGRQGLEKFSASPGFFYDAVLMDMMMPVMNGLDASRAIRALPRPDARLIPIIAMTANAYDIDVRNSLDAGMNAHLAKPIEPQILFSTLAAQIALAAQAYDRGRKV